MVWPTVFVVLAILLRRELRGVVRSLQRISAFFMMLC